MDSAHYTSFLREEVNYEIARLAAIIRNPLSTEQEREIASSMLEFYESTKAEEASGRIMKSEGSPRTRASRRLGNRSTENGNRQAA